MIHPLHRPNEQASSFILSLLVIAVLSVVAANLLVTVLPQLQARAQSSSWQEAILAAEAGADMALGELARHADDPSLADWQGSGWKLRKERTAGSAGEAGDPAPHGWPQPLHSVEGEPLRYSDTIVLDNTPMRLTSELSSQVDVQLTAYWPTPDSPPWFRIRALGTTSIPGEQAPALEKADSELRRINLHSVRSSLSGDDNLAQTVPLPNISRSIELLARPVPRFEMALSSATDLIMPESTNWKINSIASDGRSSPIWEGKAAIASSATLQTPPPVNLNWKTGLPPLNGNLYLNGPAKEIATGLPPESDPWRKHYAIITNFDQDFRPVHPRSEMNPDAVEPKTDANGKVISDAEVRFVAGATEPRCYIFSGDLGVFSVEPPPGSAAGKIQIVVRGNLAPKGAIELPPTIETSIYVRGNIDLTQAEIRGNPTQLRIYGVDSDDPAPESNPQTILLNGDRVLNALLYAPTYNLRSTGSGEATWTTSIIAHAIDLRQGGPVEILYPESLLRDREIDRYEIVRYFEDTRK
ncbi:unnamed protein product [uncultured bacterium]|nr:unnamed protein product [uncultured bacterium]